MSKLILQPCANKDALDHYRDTIENSVSLINIKQHISEKEFQILQEIYPTGYCKVWGVTPGGNNLKNWNKIQRGDVVLFSKNNAIFSSAVTTFKLYSHSLAISLWGNDKKGNTWEYIYFLDETKSINIPYIDFNRSVYKKDGTFYKDNYTIQGFTVLDEYQCVLFFERFNLESEIFIEEITNTDYQDVLNQLNDLKESDTKKMALVRKEQGYLRKILFRKKTIENCACCQKIFPVSILVTAHIKKRSLCNLNERLDKNIVIPLCKMGCDEVFEKGYIGVKGGKFIDLEKIPSTNHLKNYINSIVNNDCNYFSEHTKVYFDWHLNYHK